MRAFAALDAEIERRKRILDRANVPNVIDYERLPEARADPVPSLLVVIDEFALLVRNQPDLPRPAGHRGHPGPLAGRAPAARDAEPERA